MLDVGYELMIELTLALDMIPTDRKQRYRIPGIISYINMFSCKIRLIE